MNMNTTTPSGTPPAGRARQGYAHLCWQPGDVRSLAPRLTEEEAGDWLLTHQNRIRERLTELGWGVISDLLAFDGIEPGVDMPESDDNKDDGGIHECQDCSWHGEGAVPARDALARHAPGDVFSDRECPDGGALVQPVESGRATDDGLVRLSLRLDVTYAPNGETEATLRDRLRRVAEHAHAEGLLSGDSDAEVEEWLARVCRADGSATVSRAVTVLVYDHKHGRDLSVHASHADGYAAVVGIARRWWKDRADRSAPEDHAALSDEAVVDAYFEGHEREFYDLETVWVDFPESAASAAGRAVTPRVLVMVEGGVANCLTEGEVQVEVFDKDRHDAGEPWDIPDGFGNLAPPWLKELIRTTPRWPEGTRVLSIQGEMSDTDEATDVHTGPDAVGTIDAVLPGQENCYSVVFPNGVGVFLNNEELADPARYRILAEGESP